MKKLQQFFILTLILIFATPSIYGQEVYPEDDSCCSAYVQGSNSAHWSVYIPIALLVGAAVWFGLADRNHECRDSRDSQDGLGSLQSSKRHSKSCHNRSCSYIQSCTRSQGSYSH